MGDLKNYIDLVRIAIHAEQRNKSKLKFSPIFHFPNNDDYVNWLNRQLEEIRSKGRNWVDLYRDIIVHQMVPYGLILPEEWKKNIISYPTNCLYMLADDRENILYIGKSEYPAITRILDRMVPGLSNKFPTGQKMNDIPEIWNEYIIIGKTLKCFYCYNLDFNPEILEYYVLFEYQSKCRKLPPYNRSLPNRTVLEKSVGIFDLINPENDPSPGLYSEATSEIIMRIEEALDRTLGEQYCPICLQLPKNRRSIVNNYLQKMVNKDITDDVEQIYDVLLLDDYLIENYLLWDAKHITLEIYTQDVVDEDGAEIPYFNKNDIYSMYLEKFWKTPTNCKIGECGCKIIP